MTLANKNPQTIFDTKFATVDVERYGEYGRLVYSLEEVFKAYNFDITRQELASAQHSNISGSIGQTDITVIARSFLGWVTVPKSLSSYVAEQVASGSLPSGDYELGREPRIHAGTLASWQSQVTEALKTLVIRRNTRRYRVFIQEKAGKVVEPFRNAAKIAIADKRESIEQKRAEVLKDNKDAQAVAAHYIRTAYIVKAFCRISGLDDNGRIAGLLELAQRIEKGAVTRANRMSSILGSLDDCSVDEVIEASIRTMPDLVALWDAAEK